MTPHPLATWLQLKLSSEQPGARSRRGAPIAAKRSGPRARFAPRTTPGD